MEKYLSIAIKAAKKAGAYQARHFNTILQIRKKGIMDLVTNVDINSEKMICTEILSNFPDHSLITEEQVCSQASPNEQNKFVWIIDPLDGTSNYVHHIPFFCVSIALMIKGVLSVGVVYNPILNEFFTAVRGKGAYCNNKRMHVSKNRELAMAMLATGFAYNIKKVSDNNFNNFQNASLKTVAIRRLGSAAIDLAYVARGFFDGFWELYLKPWDKAAGALLVMEAGGKVSNFKGSSFDIFGREILATNGTIHTPLKKILK
ncbi:MAG: inositol monophosphatase [Elusimicrobia bacterium]|nr:inositol monophosphatase [Elusimicrobiota bacterium]